MGWSFPPFFSFSVLLIPFQFKRSHLLERSVQEVIGLMSMGEPLGPKEIVSIQEIANSNKLDVIVKSRYKTAKKKDPDARCANPEE